MMTISNKLKERFVRDYKIPIRLYTEPYFTDRIALYDKQFSTLTKWMEFLNMLGNYDNEEEYFSVYNKVKDDAINFIKSTDAYNEFNSIDMNQFAVTHKNLPGKDIYHADNIGKDFISIDMKKANFSSMRYYNPKIFDNANTWEEFLSKFTDNQHIINSKYIREVILGNCNPKRHITYEKYLMDCFLTKLIQSGLPLNSIIFFSNDEIIIDISKYHLSDKVMVNINALLSISPVPFKKEKFYLKGIKRTDTNEIIGYIRCIDDGTVDFKCLNNITYPFVLRKINNECIIESDVIFEYEGILSKFIKPFNIEIVG